MSIDVPEFVPTSRRLSQNPADVVSPAGDVAPVQMRNRVAGIQPYQENPPFHQEDSPFLQENPPFHYLSPGEPMTPVSRLETNFGMLGPVKGVQVGTV